MTATSFLDNVQGCVLYIQDLHSKITFTTPSDALLTSLFIKYARTIPLELFDDLLSLFQHAEFRADGVTMRISEDIMDHIADQRRANQVHNQEFIKSPNAPPALIVELVADHVESNRDAIHRKLQYEDTFRPVCESTATLRLMSLVHRSWRDAAQRRLRRCIHINSQNVLRTVFQSPQLGPWVRELRFCAYDYNAYSNETFPGNLDEMPRLLSGILRRCPNITHLYLTDFIGPAKEEANTDYEEGGKELKSEHVSQPDVIRQLGEMKYLEHLWLFATAHLPPELWKLCTILPRLQSLKSLSLDNWTSRLPSRNAGTKTMGTSGFQIDTNPPPSMEYLALYRINVVDPEPLTWIMSPRNGYNCTCLQLCLYSMFQTGGIPWDSSLPLVSCDLRPLLRWMKLSVTELRLVNLRSEGDITSVTDLFPSLRALSLSGPYTIPAQLTLPSSVRAFHFHYSISSDIMPLEDSRSLTLLAASPSVRKMLISYMVEQDWQGLDTPLPSHTIFDDSKEYCKRNNVEFSVFRIANSIPHLLDLGYLV